MGKNGMENYDIRGIVLEVLDDIGIDTETINISIEDGDRVILSGRIESRGEKEMLLQTLRDMDEIDAVVDELEIAPGIILEDLDDDETDEIDDDDLFPENEEDADEDEVVGTEDPFQSLEDGIPYIPPTKPMDSDGGARQAKWKKKKTN